ncbi:MAG: HD domain-containing protein [Acidobacteria bacterium]|nr:HD domain-containing protein [Acidobacteriota bacterium]
MRLVSTLQDNDSVVSYSQVRAKQLRLKRNGEPYLRLVLGDRSGRIESKIWDRVEELHKEIQAGDFVKYQGVVQTYNGRRQMVINQIRKVRPEDSEAGFNPTELIPSTEYDIDEMWESLYALVLEHTSRPSIKQLLTQILDAHEEEIKSYPAGMEVHHGYRGGFLEHVLSVLKSALFFAGHYPDLDKDLLIAGAVLHDIGKLEELSGPDNPVYTTRGQLIGHVVMGFELVRKEAARIPEFPPTLLTLLEHLILSHQGQLEWGSPQPPKLPEALILHYLDDLDAKVNRFSQVLKEDPGDLDFTAYDRLLGRAVFKGGYDEPSSRRANPDDA